MMPEVVNLDRYPITDLNAAGARELVTACRAMLDADGICVLEDFVPADALAKMQSDAAACFPSAYKRTHDWTVYLSSDDDPAWPEGHPRRHMIRDSSWISPADIIPDGSLIRQFYGADPLRRFCAAVLGLQTLHLHACPYQAVNVIYLEDGDHLAWHYDTDNAFTVNVLLDDAEQGGVFEVAPGIRTADDENYDDVARVLSGDRDLLKTYVHRPGSLIIFRGKNALHRVTPVSGKRRRMILVMCYEEEPGVTADPLVNAVIYGPRVAKKLGVPIATGTAP